MRFRRRPLEVDAWVFSEENVDEISRRCEVDVTDFGDGYGRVGRMVTQVGDWVVRDAAGAVSVVKPDVFEATHEQAPDHPVVVADGFGRFHISAPQWVDTEGARAVATAILSRSRGGEDPSIIDEVIEAISTEPEMHDHKLGFDRPSCLGCGATRALSRAIVVDTDTWQEGDTWVWPR